MTHIDFLVMQSTSKQTIEGLVYAGAEKAFKTKKTLFIQCQSKSHAEEIDELLWSHNPYSFIPHNLLGEGPNKPPTIQVGFENKCGNQHHQLINLSNQVPDFFSRFEHVVEFVPIKDELKQLARDRYKFYKSRGYPLKHIEIK
jgi:DNA polymerase III subunit chi